MYGCNIRSKSDEDDVVVFVLLIKVQRKLDRVRGANEEKLVREVLPPWADSIRRGVRSDAQLRPTETQFQKCSQSGKNGSKHPILSLSMAYNVIACKKSKETLKISKSPIL